MEETYYVEFQNKNKKILKLSLNERFKNFIYCFSHRNAEVNR